MSRQTDRGRHRTPRGRQQGANGKWTRKDKARGRNRKCETMKLAEGQMRTRTRTGSDRGDRERDGSSNREN